MESVYKEPIVYKNFKGIVEAVATPPNTTFENLVNLRNDRKAGGLTNRDGVGHIKTYSTSPLAYKYNRFEDVGEDSLVEIFSDKIILSRGLKDDSVADDVDLNLDAV